MAALTRLGAGGPSKNYTRPVAAKDEAVIAARALTRIGLGGPMTNYARPLAAKTEAAADEAIKQLKTRRLFRFLANSPGNY